MLNSTSTSDGAYSSTSLSPVRVNAVEPGCGAGASGPASDRRTGPQSRRVVAHAVLRREPGAIDADRGELARARVIHREEAHRRTLAVTEASRRPRGRRRGWRAACRRARSARPRAECRRHPACSRGWRRRRRLMGMFMCRAICQDSVCRTPSPISRYSSGVISCRSCTVSVTLRLPPPRTTASSTCLPTLSSSSASTASKSDIALPSIATSTSPTASCP